MKLSLADLLERGREGDIIHEFTMLYYIGV